MANAAVSDYEAATGWYGEAVGLARDLLDAPNDPLGVGDLLDLLYVRGAVHRGTSHCAAWADDYREYLTWIALQEQSPDAYEAPLTLEVHVQLAGAEFFLAHYEEAQRLLDTARDRLAAITELGATDETRLIEATLEWYQALLDRWRGMPALALGAAARAAGVYRELGAPISAARVQLVAADTLLDYAVRQPSEWVRQFQASSAGSFISEGVRLVASSGDPVGKALADLTETRWTRLSGRSANRLATIESVVRLGLKLGDEAILAQAYTALGDELRHQGHYEAGYLQYQEVNSLIEGTEIPALAVWARRALHRRWEVDLDQN